MVKKILVTGASGYLGGMLCNYLVDTQQYQVLGVARHSRDYKFDFISQDLTENFSVKLYEFEPDIIIHCAAKSTPWGDYKDFYKNNVIATQNIVNFAKKVGAKLIHISTGAIFYEMKHQYKIKEDSPFPNKRINHYAETKLGAEQIVMSQLSNYVILRPRAVFGENDTVIFPRVMAAKKIPQPKKQIVMSDVLYIDNLIFYVEQSIKLDVIGVYNINNQEEVCLHDFIQKLMTYLNRAIKTTYINESIILMAARGIEYAYRLFNIKKEPPITVFGVCVLLYSKTFDYTKAKNTFGNPPFNNEQSIRKYGLWLKKNNIT